MPAFLSTKRTCSPRFASTRSGTNSILPSSVSFMTTSTVRAGFFGSPGAPAPKLRWLWPGAPGTASASEVERTSNVGALARIRNLFIGVGFLSDRGSVIAVAAIRGARALARIDGAELGGFARLRFRGVRSAPGLRRRIAGPLVGDRALRMLVPARIAVIGRGEPRPHLHDREHAAHLDGTELRVAGHHRQRVLG